MALTQRPSAHVEQGDPGPLEPPDLDDPPPGPPPRRGGQQAQSPHLQAPSDRQAELRIVAGLLSGFDHDTAQALIDQHLGGTLTAIRTDTIRRLAENAQHQRTTTGDIDYTTLHDGDEQLARLIVDAQNLDTNTRSLELATTRVATLHRRRAQQAAAYTLARAIEADDSTATAIAEQAYQDATAQLQISTATVDWEDVGAVLRGDYKPITRAFLERSDGEGLIYPGLLHWLFSTPGIGKTWLAIRACAEAIAFGIPVVYLDWEGNRRLVGLRLQALGCSAQDVDDLFLYLRPGAIDAPRGAQLGASAHDQGAGLVIFDGFAKALAACGHDEDKSGPVLQYLADAVDPFTLQGDGAAVLMLDHVTKDKETRGLWPRGSGAKQGEVSGAAWLLRTRRAFNRETAGVLELVQAKDREGEVGIDGQVVATVHITPDQATGRLDIRLDPPTTAQTEDGGFRPTRYMERISRHLENENRFSRHPGRNELIDEVEGKKAHLTTAIGVLVQEGYVEVDVTRKTHRYVSVRPYREADELPTVDDPDGPDEAHDGPPSEAEAA